METPNQDPRLISFSALRKSIGWLGILLPAAMLTGNFLFGNCPRRRFLLSIIMMNAHLSKAYFVITSKKKKVEPNKRRKKKKKNNQYISFLMLLLVLFSF